MSLFSKALKGLAVRGEKKAVRKVPKPVARPQTEQPLAVRPKQLPKPAKPKQLPAPAKRLALPAPGPGLPPHAAKPRGGQWFTPNLPEHGAGSPERVAQYWSEGLRGAPENRQWLEKALTKYLKNDFGAPGDPIRDLAERGLHWTPGTDAERWDDWVSGNLRADKIGDLMFPPNKLGGMPGAGDDLRGGVMANMPWLAKLPVTDKVYSIAPDMGINMRHFRDEFYNALNPELSGIPPELAVRPESLGRMTFPQAAERVGQINQWRVKNAEKEALQTFDNPAVHTFKEYSENNPGGLRWVELRKPENYGEGNPLQDALKYEGDKMGHCVGGYCDEVASGASRIFSLRDAKGEPHVTIETGRPKFEYDLDYDENPSWGDIADAEGRAEAEWLRSGGLENIVQIKGKQNRTPKADYLPFVQDFVKSGKWGEIGDLSNAGMLRLPDSRYITNEQLDRAAQSQAAMELWGGDVDAARKNLQPWNINTFSDEDWERTKHLFEGYAAGGRVRHHPYGIAR